MKTRSLYLWTALIGVVAFTIPCLTRLAAQNSPIGQYSMSEWAHYQLNVNRTLETGTVGKVVGYVSNGVIGVTAGGGGGIPEAPLGTALYARSNATWRAFPPGLATMQTDAPDNGLWYSRRNGEWQNFLPGGGSGTNVGGTNRLKLAALAEFRPPDTNGTLLPANTATFIRVNHIYDPDGIFTGVDTNAGSFRLAAGYYSITMVVPVSVVEQGGGNVRIPFTIALFNLTTTNDVYYQTYTVYDEDLSQYSQVFLPALITDGSQDYTIRVFNHSTTLDLVAGQAGNVAGLENHYTEIQFLKIDGIAGLPEAPVNGSLYARSNQDWVSFTPGGSDPNTVAAVPDLATLTNSVVGYSKAIVGQTNETTQSVWQRVGLAPTWSATNWLSVLNGGALVINADGSGTISGTQPELQVVFQSISGLVDQPCRLGFYAKANEASVLRASTMQSNPVWATSTNITTDFAYYELTFTATTTTAFTSWRSTDSTSDTTTYHHVRYHYGTGPSGEFANGTTVLASAAEPGYGWKQVSLASPGGGSVTDAYLFITNITQTFPLVDYLRISCGSTLGYTLASDNVLPDGINEQTIRVLYDTYFGDSGYVNIPQDSNGTDGLGSNIKAAEGTSDIAMRPRYFYNFRFDAAQSLWILGAENTLIAGQFPAPWPPPDTNGVQLLPAQIRDQLIVELLPHLLTNYARLFPHGPGLPAQLPYAPSVLPVPRGSPASPLDVREFSPAVRGGPTYHVEVNVGGRSVEEE